MRLAILLSGATPVGIVQSSSAVLVGVESASFRAGTGRTATSMSNRAS